jgi:ligand-binding sensor domain-containing protein/two-component sensor histidine kinase
MFVAAVAVCLRGEQLPIHSYTSADGLAADHIDCVYPDSHGFVWFCTPEGLTRFDGYRLTSFGTGEGIAGGAVQTILETRARGYLVGTPAGLSHFQADSPLARFTTYRPGANNFENHITALLETSEGRIWCGTAGGLFELVNGFQFRRRSLPGPFQWERTVITDLREDAEGNLWIGTVEGIDVLGKDGSVRRISRQDGLHNEYVNRLLIDRAGSVWAGTRNGLALIRASGVGGSRVLRTFDKQDGLIHEDVFALAQGSDGFIWIGTGGGISRLLPGSGAAFENLTRRQGLIDRQIVALASDHGGNMWVGTEGAGVMRIEPSGFTTFGEADGLRSDRVWSVFGDRAGAVLAVTISPSQPKRSVNIFDGRQFHAVAPRVFGERPTWGMHQILLQSRRGEWWAATQQGLCRFAPVASADLAGRQPQRCYEGDKEVFRAFEDSRGNIWASAQSKDGDRLLRWSALSQNISTLPDGPNRSPLLVSTFAEDHSGNIWMGLWVGKELYRYDGRQFTRFSRKDGVPAGTAFAMMVDGRGRLWIAANDGLGMIENPERDQVRVRLYTTGEGLASNSIRGLAEDDSGRIYVGTARGVDRLNPATGRVRHFTTSDGLAHGEIVSAFRDIAGEIWFATTQGLSRLRPSKEHLPSIPSVRVTGLRIPREAQAVSPAGHNLLRLGKLRRWQNDLQVEFVGFNDEPEENLSYAYRLEGSESDWTITRQHTVNYAALEPGSYRFLVKAMNSEGQSSPTPAEIDFSVAPWFWETWWFRGLAVSLAGALIYIVYRYRLSRLLAVERLRTRIATDLHDDIGSSLSQIAILSEVTSRRVAPEQQSDLAEIACLSREVVDSMSEIVWAIDPSQDRLGDLLRRMRRFAGDLFTSAGVRLHFQTLGEEQQDPELGPDIRRQIFLIFKEALHNIARHSGCTEVKIEFCLEADWLSLTLTDNGKGFDPVQILRGHGLASMEERAHQLAGSLEVDAAPGRGTAVRLRVPLDQPFLSRLKQSYTNE